MDWFFHLKESNMGTRGAYGFLIDGQEKVTYNHFDSYPEGLGIKILETIQPYCQNEDGLEQMRAVARGIKLVADTEENYERLYKFQGKLGLVLTGAVTQMINNASFLHDSLFCEWAYIVNLDENLLEVYRGFTTSPKAAGRYAARHAGYKTEYYGVRLIHTYPLLELPSKEQFLAPYTKAPF
jgi:hypothetical protein